MRSRVPVDPAVQRIIETARKTWQPDEQSMCVARQQRAANHRKRVKALPQGSLQVLAAPALQAEIWTVRKTVVTVGQPHSPPPYRGPQS